MPRAIIRILAHPSAQLAGSAPHISSTRSIWTRMNLNEHLTMKKRLRSPGRITIPAVTETISASARSNLSMNCCALLAPPWSAWCWRGRSASIASAWSWPRRKRLATLPSAVPRASGTALCRHVHARRVARALSHATVTRRRQERLRLHRHRGGAQLPEPQGWARLGRRSVPDPTAQGAL